MDPHNSEPEDDSAAMAAAMGFSSFGAQDHPAKKRRYNPASDAVIASSLPAAPPGSLPPKPPAAVYKTGANNLPLHQRSARGSGAASNPADKNCEEIDLDGDDDVQSGIGLSETGGGQDIDEDLAPQYIDTSQSPVPYEKPGERSSAYDYGGERSGVHLGARAGFHPGGARGGKGGQRGPGRQQWWLDYYDPSSNENPWERIEQARGILSKGTWLTRPGKDGLDVATTA